MKYYELWVYMVDGSFVVLCMDHNKYKFKSPNDAWECLSKIMSNGKSIVPIPLEDGEQVWVNPSKISYAKVCEDDHYL